MRRCKSLGLLKSFLSYVSQLSVASAYHGELLMAVACAFHIPPPPQAPQCSPWGVAAACGSSLNNAREQALFFLGALWRA